MTLIFYGRIPNPFRITRMRIISFVYTLAFPLVDLLRLPLGYHGNLREDVSSLILFALLTIPQLVISSWMLTPLNRRRWAPDLALNTVTVVYLILELALALAAVRRVVSIAFFVFYSLESTLEYGLLPLCFLLSFLKTPPTTEYNTPPEPFTDREHQPREQAALHRVRDDAPGAAEHAANHREGGKGGGAAGGRGGGGGGRGGGDRQQLHAPHGGARRAETDVRGALL
jgi:uncharacterized membrane protein YgcG